MLTEADVKTFPQAPGTTDVGGGFLSEEDPFGSPPAHGSLDKQANEEVVKRFFRLFKDGGDPRALVSPDAQITIAGTESRLFGAERQAGLPHTGLFEGEEGIQRFFNILANERRLLSFDVEQVYGSGFSVGAFGSYKYRSPLHTGGSGDILGTTWVARFWMVQGDGGHPLIYRAYLYEDTAAQAAAFRHKFPGTPSVEWTREFAGRIQIYRTGTTDNDTLIGDAAPENVRNRLFGYAGNDYLIGNKWNDFLYGGDGNDILTSHEGHDDLYGGKGNDILIAGDGDDNLYGNEGNNILMGGPGKDIFVLEKGGSSLILDYVDGEDKLGLLGALAFGDITIRQEGDNVRISIGRTGELVGILLGVEASAITEDDFTKRSDSGALINPCRDLIGEEFERFGFNDPQYPVCDHRLTEIAPAHD